MANTDNILRQGLRELRHRLPPGWELGEPRRGRSATSVDATVDLTGPDGRSCTLGLEARVRLEPRAVRPLFESVAAELRRGPVIVLARYLGAGTRERLRACDLGYVDLTGHARVVVREPGLYVETQGAAEDPEREERPARSLRGPKAGRIVRALVDRREPPGVREFAALTHIDPGYVSRVLAFLDSEALVTRVGRGRTQSVDWPALLRRWAHEAPLESRGTQRTFLEARGLSTFLARLAASDERYVVTGGVAAASFAPSAPSRLATVWVRDAAELATKLGLRPTESGANVLLLEPIDEGVFEGATRRDGLWVAAPSQIAADLLTSPGRGPAEGEELIRWLQANEEVWRA